MKYINVITIIIALSLTATTYFFLGENIDVKNNTTQSLTESQPGPRDFAYFVGSKNMLTDAIAEFPDSDRKNAIEKFLKQNSSEEIFTLYLWEGMSSKDIYSSYLPLINPDYTKLYFLWGKEIFRTFDIEISPEKNYNITMWKKNLDMEKFDPLGNVDAVVSEILKSVNSCVDGNPSISGDKLLIYNGGLVDVGGDSSAVTNFIKNIVNSKKPIEKHIAKISDAYQKLDNRAIRELDSKTIEVVLLSEIDIKMAVESKINPVTIATFLEPKIELTDDINPESGSRSSSRHLFVFYLLSLFLVFFGYLLARKYVPVNIEDQWSSAKDELIKLFNIALRHCEELMEGRDEEVNLQNFNIDKNLTDSFQNLINSVKKELEPKIRMISANHKGSPSTDSTTTDLESEEGEGGTSSKIITPCTFDSNKIEKFVEVAIEKVIETCCSSSHKLNDVETQIQCLTKKGEEYAKEIRILLNDSHDVITGTLSQLKVERNDDLPLLLDYINATQKLGIGKEDYPAILFKIKDESEWSSSYRIALIRLYEDLVSTQIQPGMLGGFYIQMLRRALEPWSDEIYNFEGKTLFENLAIKNLRLSKIGKLQVAELISQNHWVSFIDLLVRTSRFLEIYSTQENQTISFVLSYHSKILEKMANTLDIWTSSFKPLNLIPKELYLFTKNDHEYNNYIQSLGDCESFRKRVNDYASNSNTTGKLVIFVRKQGLRVGKEWIQPPELICYDPAIHDYFLRPATNDTPHSDVKDQQ